MTFIVWLTAGLIFSFPRTVVVAIYLFFNLLIWLTNEHSLFLLEISDCKFHFLWFNVAAFRASCVADKSLVAELQNNILPCF